MTNSIAASATSEQSTDKRRRILVVDDDVDFGSSLTNLLTVEGYTVKYCQSADHANETLNSFSPEVALIDIRLGADNGIELISTLQAQKPEILCVVMTAFADLENSVLAIRRGAYDYLRKPFHSEDLFATLHRSFTHIEIVSDKIAAEEALRRTQKLDAIGQLSGGIAHDFNNQLGVIIGCLDFLKEHREFTTDADSKFDDWIYTANNATQRCIDLTRQLLTFSRQKIKKKSDVNLNTILQKLQIMIARSVTPSIIVEYRLTEELWQTSIDDGEFQDSLLNMVINARDAMIEGGTLRIETNNCYLDNDYISVNPGVEIGDYIQLSIIDSGLGMDAETLQHIFEPFFTTKSEDKGTGLGLAMVYGFVKFSGGHINVQSELNVGTTISVYLPRTEIVDRRQGVSCENIESVKISKGGETILIVDDEVALLKLAGIYLDDLGYRTRLAESAAHALEFLTGDERFDLLFSDVIMVGGFSGYELAQRAMKHQPNIKVLLTSGFTSKSVEQNNLDQYSARLLSKPYRKSDLAEHIRLVLDE